MTSIGAWKKRFHKFFDNPRALFPFLKKKFYYDFACDSYIKHYEDFDFLDYEETLNRAMEDDMSLVRFGDELISMFHGAGLYYDDWHQKYDERLAERLKEVISSNDPRLLVALHWQFFTKTNKQLRAHGIPPGIWTNSKVFLKDYLNEGQTYGAALCFQPRFNPRLDFEKLSSYFKTKHIIIVTKDIERFHHIKLGKTTDLVECPKNDAWHHYDDIFSRALSVVRQKEYPKEDVLFLVSLASAAKVFVFDLLEEGYQGWDTGQFFDLAHKKIEEASRGK